MTYEIVKSMEDILQDEGLLSEIVMVMLWPTKPHSGNVKLLVGFFSSKNKKHFITLWYEDILTNKKIFWTYYYRFTSKCLYITQQHFYIYWHKKIYIIA